MLKIFNPVNYTPKQRYMLHMRVCFQNIELDAYEGEITVDSLRDCSQPLEDMEDLQPHRQCTHANICVAYEGVFLSIELDATLVNSTKIAINFVKT